jgi:hypothetical protein
VRRQARLGLWSAPPPEPPRPDPAQVDRILEKIKAHGMGSLTHRERALLDEASRQRR